MREGDLDTEALPVFDKCHYLFGVVVRIDHDRSDAYGFEPLNDSLKHRHTANLHEAFGGVFGEIFQARADTGGEDHRFRRGGEGVLPRWIHIKIVR